MPDVMYVRPEGDSAEVFYCGVRFLDGIPVEVEDGSRALLKARTNPHFVVNDAPPVRRGRPPKAPVADDPPPASSEA